MIFQTSRSHCMSVDGLHDHGLQFSYCTILTPGCSAQYLGAWGVPRGQASRCSRSGVPWWVSTLEHTLLWATVLCLWVHVDNYILYATVNTTKVLMFYACSPYVTRSDDHDHHMTVFPSMRPAGRHEAITLKVRFTCSAEMHTYTYVYSVYSCNRTSSQ